jgi:DUF971 family protein
MSPMTTPTRLDLKRDERLEIQWQDGVVAVYPIALLRAMCPCAKCKDERKKPETTPSSAPGGKRKTSLNVLSGDHSRPLSVLSAEMVGNYAIKLDWSDGHSSGIYSFQYLREICPAS